MGNRAVLTFDTFSQKGLGMYVHWHGGRDSIEGFLEAARQVMGDRLGDESYGKARLAQVIGTFLDGNSSFGLGSCEELDCDNGDNGTYIIDSNTMTIKGRKFAEGCEEQRGYDPMKIAESIVAKIKAATEAGED